MRIKDTNHNHKKMKRNLKINEKVSFNAIQNGEHKKCFYFVSEIKKDKSIVFVAESIFTEPQKITLRKKTEEDKKSSTTKACA